MDIEGTAEKAVLIAVASGQGSGWLAQDTLAQALGLDREEAGRALSQPHAVVEARAEAPASSLVLLQLLGVQTQPVHGGAARFDLSIRLRDAKDGAALSRIAALCPGADLAALQGIAGLVLRDLTAEGARLLAEALQRRPGIEVTLAPQTGAVYDIFAPKGFATTEALQSYLSVLGHGACAPVAHLEGAIACGLAAPLAERLMARFAGLGLVAVHPAFLRFDLHVTGPGRLAPREAADFLLSRGHFEAAMALQRGEVALVEQGLNRARVRQFLNDYNLIGLPTRLSLCGGPR